MKGKIVVIGLSSMSILLQFFPAHVMVHQTIISGLCQIWLVVNLNFSEYTYVYVRIYCVEISKLKAR